MNPRKKTELSTLIYRYLMGLSICERQLIDLLLEERASLKRVVSAPQARNHEAPAEPDLGPVSAPCSRAVQLIRDYDIAKRLDELVDSFGWPWDSPQRQASRHLLSVAQNAIKEHLLAWDEPNRGAGAPQGGEAAR